MLPKEKAPAEINHWMLECELYLDHHLSLQSEMFLNCLVNLKLQQRLGLTIPQTAC